MSRQLMVVPASKLAVNNALRQYVKATSNLLDAWEALQNDAPELEQMLLDCYPFNESFTDVLDAVITWRDDTTIDEDDESDNEATTAAPAATLFA